MRIPGSARLPVVVIKATVVGPKIIADKKRLVFKSAKVLEPSTQSLVFSNLSVIPAPFKAFVRKKKSCFRLSTTEATIPPGDKIELKRLVYARDSWIPEIAGDLLTRYYSVVTVFHTIMGIGRDVKHVTPGNLYEDYRITHVNHNSSGIL
eukprot:1338971-Amorphochlora_amoeboformis.AAC.1